MNTKLKLMIVLILIISCIASAAKISYYPNGKMAIWIEDYNDECVNGRYIKYYENGNIEIDSYKKNSNYNGKHIEYYMDGKIRTKTNYKMGRLDGGYISYYENGKIEIKTNYNSDDIDGEYIRYYPNGKIDYKINYKNGKKEGEHIKYYENGVITATGNYKNDKLIGVYKIYKENEKYLPVINFEIEDETIITEASNEESDNTFIWIGGDCLRSSSELTAEKGNSYSVKNIGDFKLNTAWIEGNADYGVGEWIEKVFFTKEDNSYYYLYGLKSIYIYNGYCKNQKTWKENSRVKKLKMYLNDIPYAVLELKDSMEEQSFETYLPFDYVMGIYKIKFEIMEVYQGEKYKDSAISEIFLQQGGLCFPASTKITLSDNSAKTIDQIKLGDEILTYNSADNKFEKTKVVSVAKVPHNNLVEIDFGDKVITSTDDHPYLSENGWKSCNVNGTKQYKGYENVKEMKKGDKIYFIGENGKSELKEVKGIKKVDKKEMCYTITKLENGDNFIADGAVVGVEEIE